MKKIVKYILLMALTSVSAYSCNSKNSLHIAKDLPYTEMNEQRASHTATILPNGKVLITGGFKKASDGHNQIYFSSSEIYDPEKKSFSKIDNMNSERCGHTATLLTNSKVLILGGWNSSGRLASAELYDIASGKFIPVGNMNFQRASFTATLLQTGKVLITGGDKNKNDCIENTELYDPETNSFSLSGSMKEPRSIHTATLLNDGRVLITGGISSSGSVLSSSEIYDPVSGNFSFSGNLNIVRYKHSAVQLTDGNVLILAGSNKNDWTGKYKSAEIYDTKTSTFESVSDLEGERFKLIDALALLGNGLILVGGGNKKLEIYDPASKSFSTYGELDDSYFYSTATLLNNGSVLISGGYNTKIKATNKAWQINFKNN